MNITINNIDELDEVARKLLSRFVDSRVFCFFGSMGAGKTTFIKRICKELQVVDQVTSPTFALINEYETVDGKPIYHFDFYRINGYEEALNIGYEEYIYSGDYCFLEWPERVSEIIPEEFVSVSINTNKNGSRTIMAEHVSL